MMANEQLFVDKLVILRWLFEEVEHETYDVQRYEAALHKEFEMDKWNMYQRIELSYRFDRVAAKIKREILERFKEDTRDYEERLEDLVTFKILANISTYEVLGEERDPERLQYQEMMHSVFDDQFKGHGLSIIDAVRVHEETQRKAKELLNKYNIEIIMYLEGNTHGAKE